MISGASQLSSTHPVAVAAARLCAEHLGSQPGRIGRVACGACWEQAIRADERVAVWFDLPSVPPVPAPELVDEIAVEVAAAGVRPVSLTRAERLAAVALLLSRGLNVSEIGKRLRLNGSTAAALVAQVRAGAESGGRADRGHDWGTAA